jgi:hypothetical protein
MSAVGLPVLFLQAAVSFLIKSDKSEPQDHTCMYLDASCKHT